MMPPTHKHTRILQSTQNGQMHVFLFCLTAVSLAPFNTK